MPGRHPVAKAHGSGRTMSRTKARQQFHAQTLLQDMAERGIYVRSVSKRGLSEEAGAAYKNIDEFVDAVHRAGVSRKVVRLIPVGNVKG